MRPNDTGIGPWELGTLAGNALVWIADQYPTGAMAMLVVDL